MTSGAAIAHAPTPQEIDAAAAEYCELEKKIENIQAAASEKVKPLRDELAPLGEKLKAWVSSFGGAHASKSKLLTGAAYEVMTTAASSTSLDQATVGLFYETCCKLGKSRIFGRLFESLITYRVRPEADQVARKDLSARLALGFSRCFVTKSFATRMEVRPRKKPTATVTA